MVTKKKVAHAENNLNIISIKSMSITSTKDSQVQKTKYRHVGSREKYVHIGRAKYEH